MHPWSNRRACPSLHPSLQDFRNKSCTPVRTSAHCVHVVPLPRCSPNTPPHPASLRQSSGGATPPPRLLPAPLARLPARARIPAGSSLLRAHPAGLASASPEEPAQNCGGPECGGAVWGAEPRRPAIPGRRVAHRMGAASGRILEDGPGIGPRSRTPSPAQLHRAQLRPDAVGPTLTTEIRRQGHQPMGLGQRVRDSEKEKTKNVQARGHV